MPPTGLPPADVAFRKLFHCLCLALVDRPRAARVFASIVSGK
jgi:hypothetical protein